MKNQYINGFIVIALTFSAIYFFASESAGVPPKELPNKYKNEVTYFLDTGSTPYHYGILPPTHRFMDDDNR